MRRGALLLMLIGLLAACGGVDERPLPPASEIVYQSTAEPRDPIPPTLLQPGDVPVDVVATRWPRLQPNPFQSWECPLIGPATLADGDPVRVQYDVGGDTVTAGFYPEDSIGYDLLSELEPEWETCRTEVAERGHPEATKTLDLGPDAFGFVSRRVDETIEGEAVVAKVGGDYVSVTVMSYGGRDPSVRVEDLLPQAITRAEAAR